MAGVKWTSSFNPSPTSCSQLKIKTDFNQKFWLAWKHENPCCNPVTSKIYNEKYLSVLQQLNWFSAVLEIRSCVLGLHGVMQWKGAGFENGLRWGGKERDKDLICNIFGLQQVVHWSWQQSWCFLLLTLLILFFLVDHLSGQTFKET